MLYLEERIRKDGQVRAGNILKVDSFLNHQMDPEVYREMGKEFYRLFGGEGVTKILTIEASGIGIACVAAQFSAARLSSPKRAAPRTSTARCSPARWKATPTGAATP